MSYGLGRAHSEENEQAAPQNRDMFTNSILKIWGWTQQVITLLGIKALERGVTTISDMEVFPQRSHTWNTWRRAFIALATLLEESLEAKIQLNLLQNGKWQFKCKGPQKTQGKEKSTYTKVQFSILGDIDRHLLIEPTSTTLALTKIKLITEIRNLSIDHMSHQGREAALKHVFKPRLNTVHAEGLQHLWLSMPHPRQSTAQTTHPCRRYTKIRNSLVFLRLTDVFQEQWNGVACFATCSSFSTIPPPSTLRKGITQLHSQKLPQAAAAEGSLSKACTTALQKKANHSIS